MGGPTTSPCSSARARRPSSTSWSVCVAPDASAGTAMRTRSPASWISITPRSASPRTVAAIARPRGRPSPTTVPTTAGSSRLGGSGSSRVPQPVRRVVRARAERRSAVEDPAGDDEEERDDVEDDPRVEPATSVGNFDRGDHGEAEHDERRADDGEDDRERHRHRIAPSHGAGDGDGHCGTLREMQHSAVCRRC